MLNFRMPSVGHRFCDGLTRRQTLRLGATGLFGGLTLPQLLRAEDANKSERAREAKAKSCLFIFLEGGPPQQDMWDPKPDAPSEIRGPFEPISTALPGVIFTEHCKNCAKIANKFTVVRSHSHADNGHATGYHYVMTGHRAAFADGEYPLPTNELFPSLGSIVARELGNSGTVPPYINLPHPMSAGGPGFFGAEFSPFVIEADPSQPDFEVRDLAKIDGVSTKRSDLRQKLLAGLEQRPTTHRPSRRDEHLLPKGSRPHHVAGSSQGIRHSIGTSQRARVLRHDADRPEHFARPPSD